MHTYTSYVRRVSVAAVLPFSLRQETQSHEHLKIESGHGVYEHRLQVRYLHKSQSQPYNLRLRSTFWVTAIVKCYNCERMFFVKPTKS